MLLPKDRIRFLLEAYTSQKTTAAQEEELMNWVMGAQENEELKEYMQEVWNSFQPGVHTNNLDWDGMFNTIMQDEKVIPIARIRTKYYWMRVAAAVVAIAIVSVSGYYYFTGNSAREMAKTTVPNADVNDVAAPTSNKARLTLADGRVIELDSAGQGALALQGTVHIEKTADGQIIYKGDASEIKMNTLSVPRGSKPVQLVLADGSEVWLNAASSITYPTAFAGNERKVSMTGEAYFEIAHDASKPFLVSKGEMNIRVLGTHFNVNAYDDEDEMKVTLLQGSVNVSAGTKSAILKPGEQAQVLTSGTRIQTTNEVNVEQVMAWKNGLFSFEQTNLKDVMRQLSRWYDVEVIYQGAIPNLAFGGDIQRTLDLSQILEALSKNGVHFKIEGKEIIVTP